MVAASGPDIEASPSSGLDVSLLCLPRPAPSRRQVITSLRLTDLARRAVDALAAEGIDARVLKGPAVAALDYTDGVRTFTDVDLLVRPSDLERALRVAATLAPTQPIVPPTEFTKATTVRYDDGTSLDLHVRLSKYSLADHEFLFDRPAAIPGLGSALPVELRLVHAALHLTTTPTGFRRPSGLVDISMIARRDDLDPDDARRAAARLGVERLAAPALLAERRTSGEVGAWVEEWSMPDRLERAAFLADRRRPLLERAIELRAAPDRSTARRLARSIAVPSSAELALRDGYWGYLRRAWRGRPRPGSQRR